MPGRVPVLIQGAMFGRAAFLFLFRGLFPLKTPYTPHLQNLQNSILQVQALSFSVLP